MANGTRTKGDGEALPNGAVSASDSGVWARLATNPRRRQEGPLGGPASLPPGVGWCAALALFVGAAAIVLGTLLHLTRELLELGHPGSPASADER
jgi:hypothetical protein